MSGSSKHWEVVSSIGLIASMAILLSPSIAHADTRGVAPGIAKAEIVAPKPTFGDSHNQAPIASSPLSQSSPIFAVGHLDVVGSTVLSAADLKSITKPIAQQPISLVALNQVVDSITQLYLKRGFATSRAILPPQTLTNNGTVTLEVIEGWLGDIQVKGTRQLQSRYIKSRLRLAAGSPLNLERLEAQIRLLNTDPHAQSC